MKHKGNSTGKDGDVVKKRQGAKVFKSAEFIENSSDLELEDLPESKPKVVSPKKNMSPKKNAVKAEPKGARKVVESDSESEPEPPKTQSSTKKSPKDSTEYKDVESEDEKVVKASPKKASGSKETKFARKSSSQTRRKIADTDEESETDSVQPASKRKVSAAEDDELTSLFGDSPKPKKARASGEKFSANESTTMQSKSQSASAKHAETIKKLKSFVNACGVRKPWVKIFKDTPKPTQQIAKLREILTDLGMTGRLSMEQAKRIKAERELAKELEDVQSFEQSVLERSHSRTASSSRNSIRPADCDSEEAEDDVKQRRRKMPALRSIEAFLGSQSDEE
ncbi:hypothetical protein H0H87_006074 [Tephrocybe sp. NHM501043]|nr:hypothetical protein H0H87_006074 [Tephrocybe sp. NHM501043]